MNLIESREVYIKGVWREERGQRNIAITLQFQKLKKGKIKRMISLIRTHPGFYY